MKTIREFADEIGVSRQAVYKKIKEVGLDGKLTKSDNRLTISLQQENLLKSAFNIQTEDDYVNQVDSSVNQSDNQFTDVLLEQLRTKDEQIRILQKALSDAQKNLDQEQTLHLSTQKKLNQFLMIEEKKEEPKEKENIEVEQSQTKSFWKFWK